MNHTVTQPVYPVVTTQAHRGKFLQSIRDGNSLLDRIVSRLVKSLTRYRIPELPVLGHRVFVEEHLLDQNIGPEIQRALR